MFRPVPAETSRTFPQAWASKDALFDGSPMSLSSHPILSSYSLAKVPENRSLTSGCLEGSRASDSEMGAGRAESRVAWNDRYVDREKTPTAPAISNGLRLPIFSLEDLLSPRLSEGQFPQKRPLQRFPIRCDFRCFMPGFIPVEEFCFQFLTVQV